MKYDYTKTDRILLLIQSICKAPRLSLSEKKVQEILGTPSRAQWYKLKQELTEDVGTRRALLLELKDDDGNVKYQLNQCDWYQYLEGSQEIQFLLKSYRELGHLFPNLDTDGVVANSKNLERKFYYLCKIKSKHNIDLRDNTVEEIIRSLVGNRKMLIDYQGTNDEKIKTIDIYPLTLTQYRDELYLIAYKSEIKDENIRSYKISRIKKLQQLKDTFKYPSSKNWNPTSYFENSSGIIIGKETAASFRVYGSSKKIIYEKQFFNSKLIHETREYDEYTCSYTNIEEFMGQLFIYGQDIQVLSPMELKKAFLNKAEQIILRNKR